MLRSKLGESWKNRSRSYPYCYSIPFPDVLPEFYLRIHCSFVPIASFVISAHGVRAVSYTHLQKPNAKEKVLIESLIGDGTEENTAQHYTKDNGFGLYDPALEVNLPEITQDKGFNVKKAFEFICFGRAKLVFKKLSKYIEIYKNEEFKNGYGEARLVGNSVLINWSNYGGLSGLGFPELWKAFYEEEIGSYDKLLMMSFMPVSYTHLVQVS